MPESDSEYMKKQGEEIRKRGTASGTMEYAKPGTGADLYLQAMGNIDDERSLRKYGRLSSGEKPESKKHRKTVARKR